MAERARWLSRGLRAQDTYWITKAEPQETEVCGYCYKDEECTHEGSPIVRLLTPELSAHPERYQYVCVRSFEHMTGIRLEPGEVTRISMPRVLGVD